MIKTFYKITLFLFLCLAVTRNQSLAAAPTDDAAVATLDEHASILLITSYNPDTRVMADNLTAFLDTYRRRGCHNPDLGGDDELQELVGGARMAGTHGRDPAEV